LIKTHIKGTREFQLQIFQWTRSNILILLDSLSFAEINKTPEGFNNNIIWNAGHIHWAQQVLVYQLSALPVQLPHNFPDKYATGSAPKAWVDQEEFDLIRSHLEKSTRETLEDYQGGLFQSFTPLRGIYGIVKYQLNTWEESFQYNNIHETWHRGYMTALKNALK
jgi:hypothetical protein